MEDIVIGEILTLSNGKDYIVYDIYKEDNETYVYLLSNFKPLEIKYTKQVVKDNQIALEMVTDKALKLKLFEHFNSKYQE